MNSRPPRSRGVRKDGNSTLDLARIQALGDLLHFREIFADERQTAFGRPRLRYA